MKFSEVRYRVNMVRSTNQHVKFFTERNTGMAIIEYIVKLDKYFVKS